jgi:2',3'-cyclic-nucleotide 2'-phosphodiesterase (5'-nucleotidase family)
MLKKSRKIGSIIICILFGLFWVGSSLFAGDGELVILHTNDIHGSFLPRQATWIDSRPLIGGFAPLSGAIADERSSEEAAILLDAGDFMTGNPITDLTVDGVEGGAMLQFFDMMNYDAVTLGNHEFDLGVGNAVKLVNASKVPIMSANLWMVLPDAISQKPIARLLTEKGWKIFEVGGVRVGVIGLIMENLDSEISKSAAEAIHVTPPAEEVRKTVEEIDPITDLIILLTHEGYEEDQQLASEVAGVDVIIGGHSHTRVESPQRYNNVIVAQAGAYCQYLGRLWVKVENDEVTDFRGNLIPLWVDSLPPTPEAAEFVQKYQNEIDKQFGKVIATLDEDWTRDSYQESPLGDWLADRLREYGKGDFAVVNSGGIRKDLLKGPVTIMDIKEMLPFTNRVVSFPCTGEQLSTLIATNARVGISHHGEILQVSGVSYDIDPSTMAPYNIMVDGKPLKLKKQYKGISIDYVAVSQAERYFGFMPASHDDLGIAFTDMIVDYVTEHGINKKPPMGRIVVKVK